MYARIRRGGEEGALLALDLDHFKQINDTYGHAAGDDVLRAFAAVVTSKIRPSDQVYRVGGEEFSVLLPGTSMAAASELAERLRDGMAAHIIPTSDGEITATVSIGGAKATAALAPGQLVVAADAALYRAKTTGRNRVVLIDEFGAHDGSIKRLETVPGKDKAGRAK